MSLRRSLSDITKLEMRVQAVEAENARLREAVAALTSGQAVVTPSTVSGPSADAPASISELLQREERPHPASGSKKRPKTVRKSKRGYLRGVPPGSVLNQAQIIAGLREQEMTEADKAERKAAAKSEAQELRKRARAEAAAEKKRKKAGAANTPLKKRESGEVARGDTEEEEESKDEAQTNSPSLYRSVVTALYSHLAPHSVQGH
jgi:hypothetical protein